MFRRALVVLGLVASAACGEHGATPEPAALAMTDLAGAPLTNLDFGATAIGQLATLTFDLRNTGGQATGPVALELRATNEFAITSPSCTGAELAGGSTCRIVLSFTPTTDGVRSVELVATADPGGTARVAIAALATRGNIVLDPPGFEFAIQELSTSAQTTVHVSNTGAGPAALMPLSTFGAAFSVVASTCGATLDPQASCDVTVGFAASALGTVSGGLVITADGVAHTVPLAGTGGSRITVSPSGTGTATVTSSPAGIACTSTGAGTCTMLAAGDVTLSVQLATGSSFSGWGTALCSNTSFTCLLQADVLARTVSPAFSGSTSTLSLVLGGTAPGVVSVIASSAVVGTCQSTCTAPGTCSGVCAIPVATNATIDLDAVTPSLFGSFTGACTTARCTLSTANPTVNVTFAQRPNEAFTHVESVAQVNFFAGAFDDAGNLFATVGSAVRKLAPDGTVTPMGAQALALAKGPAGSVYALFGANVKKLAADGTLEWTSDDIPSNFQAWQNNPFPFVSHFLAVAPNGDVVVGGQGRVRVFDANGKTRWGFLFPFDSCGAAYSVAVDSTGTVYVDRGCNIARFDANGNQLADFAAGTGAGMFAIDADDHVVLTRHSNTTMSIASYTRAGQLVFERTRTVAGQDANGSGVAIVAGNHIAWFYRHQQNTDVVAQFVGYTIERLDAAGNADGGSGAFATTEHEIPSVSGFVGNVLGAVAGSGDGHLALIGSMLPAPADLNAGRPFVQVFAP
jgi:hypothetical protein